METWFEADGSIVLSVDGAELHMTREEAESLFVMLGHTLQDHDIFDNTPEGDQPEG